MRYILTKRVALRQWNDVRYPYGILIKKTDSGMPLTKEEFELLKLADGQMEIPDQQADSDIFKKLLEKKIVRVAEDGEKLTDWQQYRYCDNPKYNAISLRLTGRCNYNCKHCFNAADVNTDMSQWKYEEIEKLVNEASECGIGMFRLTGGEPMLHPDFLKVIRLISEKNMLCRDILTNGAFITQEVLDEIKQYNRHAVFVISFDCLHHHDWMRGQEGSEKKTIDAIKLCVDNGFRVLLNVQANRITMDSLVETAEFFDTLGVTAFRFIRTSETPRWREYAGSVGLSMDEYYDLCVEFLKRYNAREHKMDIVAWQFGQFHSKEKRYCFMASRCDASRYSDDYFSCTTMAKTVSLGSNGNMYPCHQVSGQFDYMGWELPNVKKVGLRAAMNDPGFIHTTRITWGEIAKANQMCRECAHFKQCGGGCRASGFLYCNCDMLGSDLYMCRFYEGNYPDKVAEVLKDWTVEHKPVESRHGEKDLLDSACDIVYNTNSGDGR